MFYNWVKIRETSNGIVTFYEGDKKEQKRAAKRKSKEEAKNGK